MFAFTIFIINNYTKCGHSDIIINVRNDYILRSSKPKGSNWPQFTVILLSIGSSTGCSLSIDDNFLAVSHSIIYYYHRL